MRAFSTVDLVRKIGDVTHAADKAPVAITQHRKPRYVLMRVEDFEKLAGQGEDVSSGGMIDAMPAPLFEAFKAAVAVYEQEGEAL